MHSLVVSPAISALTNRCKVLPSPFWLPLSPRKFPQIARRQLYWLSPGYWLVLLVPLLPLLLRLLHCMRAAPPSGPHTDRGKNQPSRFLPFSDLRLITSDCIGCARCCCRSARPTHRP